MCGLCKDRNVNVQSVFRERQSQVRSLYGLQYAVHGRHGQAVSGAPGRRHQAPRHAAAGRGERRPLLSLLFSKCWEPFIDGALFLIMQDVTYEAWQIIVEVVISTESCNSKSINCFVNYFDYWLNDFAILRANIFSFYHIWWYAEYHLVPVNKCPHYKLKHSLIFFVFCVKINSCQSKHTSFDIYFSSVCSRMFPK